MPTHQTCQSTTHCRPAATERVWPHGWCFYPFLFLSMCRPQLGNMWQRWLRLEVLSAVVGCGDAAAVCRAAIFHMHMQLGQWRCRATGWPVSQCCSNLKHARHAAFCGVHYLAVEWEFGTVYNMSEVCVMEPLQNSLVWQFSMDICYTTLALPAFKHWSITKELLNQP
jgi:hypothetical protein